MNFLLPLLMFLLGLLIGALWMAKRAIDHQKAQAEVIRQYHIVLQTHLDRSYELADTHQQLQATVAALREQCLRLELQREKLLASLN